MDPIQGVDQTHGTFWKRVHAYFHGNNNFTSESTRSESSLMNRWSGIQHDLNLFCSYLSMFERSQHSGWSVGDKVIFETHNLSCMIMSQCFNIMFTLVQMCR
jgi:hypothetical protein